MDVAGSLAQRGYVLTKRRILSRAFYETDDFTVFAKTIPQIASS